MARERVKKAHLKRSFIDSYTPNSFSMSQLCLHRDMKQPGSLKSTKGA